MATDNVLFDLSTKMNILTCTFNDLLEELNTIKDQINIILAEQGTKLTSKQEEKLELISYSMHPFRKK
jgi:hypothetical protein